MVNTGVFAVFKSCRAWMALCLSVWLIAWPSPPVEGGQFDKKESADMRRMDQGASEEEAGGADNAGPIPTEFELAGVAARLSGLLESNFEYLDVSDTGDKNSRRGTDFFMSTLGIALRLFFNDWSKAKLAVAAEDIGRDDGSGRVLLDEATLTVKCPWAPLYLHGGKSVMPFGAFEDHLISGTLTEDLYEIDQWGATIGATPDFLGAELSLSVYREPQIIENLSNFNPDAYRRVRKNGGACQSFVLNAALEPLEDTLYVRAFFDSEPGFGNRNQTIGGALTLDVWSLSLDLEYIAALTREKGINEEENKESAWLIGLSFDLLDSLELAARCEVFRDDDIGRQDEVLDYRLVAGFNYSFLKYAVFSFEYGFLKFEREKGSSAADRQNAIQVQLALEF